ncbi:TIGR01777 family oxidoreductase [Legionella micdadei]|uniref:Uncharacterized protein n=1 Tax=Legionella micdadei TaxID=451 RepID=A0A098GFQ5_LEGMI|nr:TIGR01777 family oxidoreductase [Legionella micdadei]ARG98053.1 TIGR01777 family protein [Legionella micdadei]ARH00848.1 TIGR01777 family protein [Legionella micdadei]KTD30121.1 nucleoside-diphosphate sugar epimerase [Legionella micdadei]NSL18504.1 TIGR01777 family protein [Legionella micdadei]CEG60316.1 conserved protein of unknown function [Legionella micdadei]
MNILIAGASGFIGHNLINALRLKHTITALGRNEDKLKKCFPKKIKVCTWEKLADLDPHSFDAVINLSGYNISGSRWSEKVKQKIINSRVSTTTDLINWAMNQKAKPHFYCANAVGIYGMQNNDDPKAFDETSLINFNQPHDILSEICIRWQNALQPAIDYGIPVTITRFGVVLKKGEGMLKKLFPSFYMGLGATLGDGKQIISWVHIDDVIGAYLFLLDNPQLTGSFNITAPIPVSQAQFARTLAKAMHRPLFLTIPPVVVKTLFGEMGECLLLKGQRVVPKRLVDSGYQFHYPELTTALAHEFE